MPSCLRVKAFLPCLHRNLVFLVVDWFNQHARHGWATCALTQAGFIRVLSQPALGVVGSTTTELAALLKRNVSHHAHKLLALDFDFNAVTTCCTGGVHAHRQITDAYLLTAAMRAGMKLLTFDRGLGTLLASPAERSAHIEVLQ